MVKSAKERAEAAARAVAPTKSAPRDHDTRDVRDALETPKKNVQRKRLSVDVELEAFARFAKLAALRGTSKKQLAERLVLAATLDPDLLDRADRAIGR